MYDYLSGIDIDDPAARYRPGLGLLLAMVEEASLQRLSTVDLLRGDEPYKLDFSTASSYNRNYRLSLPARRNRFDRVLYLILSGIGFVRFHFEREAMLLAVQYRSHGAASCLYHYVQFRSSRLQKKLQSRQGSEGETDE